MIVKIGESTINLNLVRDITEIRELKATSGNCSHGSRVYGYEFSVVFSASDTIRIGRTERKDLEKLRGALMDYWTKGATILEL